MQDKFKKDWEDKLNNAMAATLFTGANVHDIAKASIFLKNFITTLLQEQEEKVMREERERCLHLFKSWHESGCAFQRYDEGVCICNPKRILNPKA